MSGRDAMAIEAIRRTIHSYTIAGDSRNAALFHTLWARDSVLEFDGFPPVPGFRCEGRVEIHARTATWDPDPDKDPSFARTRFIRHNLTTSLIELTGPDSARARTYFIVFTEIGQDHMGSYNDEFAREGENWPFAHRRIVVDWRAENSLFPPLK